MQFCTFSDIFSAFQPFFSNLEGGKHSGANRASYAFFKPMLKNAFFRTQNNYLPTKVFQKGLFLTVYTRLLDSVITSQNVTFGQVKKIAEVAFQYTFFHSVRMRKKVFLAI